MLNMQKPIHEKLYLQAITDAFVKIDVLERCFEKKTKKSVVGPLKIYVQ